MQEMEEKHLYGVGGWLALLAVALTILAPLLILGGTGSEIGDVERSNPSIAENASWQGAKSALLSISVVTALFSMYAGYRLWRQFVWTSVLIAITALWVNNLVRPLLSGVALVWIMEINSSEVGGEILTTIVKGSFIAGIWTAYLLMSERVSNTYVRLGDE